MIPVNWFLGYFVAGVGTGFLVALIVEGSLLPVSLAFSVVKRVFGRWL